MYQSRSITTVPEPLSADLMTMSVHLLSILETCRSRVVRLSLTGAGLSLKRSCPTASRKVSSAGSLRRGGVQLLLVRNGLILYLFGGDSHESTQGDASVY